MSVCLCVLLVRVGSEQLAPTVLYSCWCHCFSLSFFLSFTTSFSCLLIGQGRAEEWLIGSRRVSLAVDPVPSSHAQSVSLYFTSFRYILASFSIFWLSYTFSSLCVSIVSLEVQDSSLPGERREREPLLLCVCVAHAVVVRVQRSGRCLDKFILVVSYMFYILLCPSS